MSKRSGKPKAVAPSQSSARGRAGAKSEGGKIAYQGEPGANSHMAAVEAFPDYDPLACASFEDALEAVKQGTARYAMIPIENSVAGRVADIHHLLPGAGLFIVGEHFMRIRFHLMGVPGSGLDKIRDVYSHVHALGQCRKIIRRLGVTPHVSGDTAGAAREVAEWGDPSKAALAPFLAAKTYGLEVFEQDVEDEEHNTTRFVVLSAEPEDCNRDDGPFLTTFIFRVRNVPAALYKALGGFATNSVNMIKLESYQPEGSFRATMFFADIEGHPSDPNVQLAFEELRFFSSELTVLGTYPASPYRQQVGT